MSCRQFVPVIGKRGKRDLKAAETRPEKQDRRTKKGGRKKGEEKKEKEGRTS